MFHKIVTVNEMQVRLMPEKETINAVFIRRLHEMYHAKKESYIHVLRTWRKLFTDYQGKCWNEQ